LILFDFVSICFSSLDKLSAIFYQLDNRNRRRANR